MNEIAMNMNIDKIVSALPELSAAELDEVHSRLAALRTIGGGGRKDKITREINSFAKDAYVVISEAMSKRTRVRNGMPFSAFTKQTIYESKFLPAVKVAEEANAQWFHQQSKAERMSMLMLYADLVLDFLSDRRMPAVWGSISYALSNLPMIVDLAFPGYAEAGLLGKVHTLRTKRANV